MKARQQASFLNAHRPLLRLFSQVTIAFQLFFVAWLAAFVGWWLVPLMLVLILAFYLAQQQIGKLAIGLFAVSLLLFASFWMNAPELPAGTLQSGWWHTLLPLILGFALSPYLDLTFHRALALSPNPRMSFGLGFGVFFLILLLFVLAYSAALAPLMAGEAVALTPLWPVLAFILLQTAFTSALHLQEMQRQQPSQGRSGLIFLGIYLLLIFLLLDYQAGWLLPWIHVPLGEVLYKTFLLFYGLVAPLYLLLGKRTKTYLFSLLLIAPLYSLGFLLGGDYLFLLTLAMILLGVIYVQANKIKN